MKFFKKPQEGREDIEALMLISLILWFSFQALLFSCRDEFCELEKFKAVWKGMQEKEMLRRMEKLGFHQEAEYSKDNVPEDYYWEIQDGERKIKHHTVSNKVYIYKVRTFESLIAAYLWIDEKGLVEDLAIVYQKELD